MPPPSPQGLAKGVYFDSGEWSMAKEGKELPDALAPLAMQAMQDLPKAYFSALAARQLPQACGAEVQQLSGPCRGS